MILWRTDMQSLLLPVTLESLVTSTGMVLSFIGVLFLGSILLPGLERQGYPLSNGETRTYKLTGMGSFLLLHIVVAIMTFGLGLSLMPILQHFWSLLIVANVTAILWSLALYVYGRRSDSVLTSEIGDNLSRPNQVNDIWFGNELNPTWLGVDLKMFM